MKIKIILILLLTQSMQAKNYINYGAIHTAVDMTLKEKERTKKLLDKQSKVTLLDETNSLQSETLKGNVKKIDSRLQSLGLLLDGLDLFVKIRPMIKNIKENISKIANEATDDPLVVPLMLTMQTNVINEVDDLSRFFTATILSVGVLNQMEASDRKILLNHIEKQVFDINVSTDGAISVVRNYKMQKQLLTQQWKDVLVNEREIIKDIINNAKMF